MPCFCLRLTARPPTSCSSLRQMPQSPTSCYCLSPMAWSYKLCACLSLVSLSQLCHQIPAEFNSALPPDLSEDVTDPAPASCQHAQCLLSDSSGKSQHVRPCQTMNFAWIFYPVGPLGGICQEFPLCAKRCMQNLHFVMFVCLCCHMCFCFDSCTVSSSHWLSPSRFLITNTSLPLDLCMYLNPHVSFTFMKSIFFTVLIVLIFNSLSVAQVTCLAQP